MRRRADRRAAARVELEVGEHAERPRQTVGVGARDVGDEALGGARGHAQAAAHVPDRLAGLQAQRDRKRLAQALGHQVGQPGQPLALAAQAQVGERRLRGVAADERVGQRERAVLGGVGGAALDLLDADPLGLSLGLDFQRELLQLAQQPLLASAHLGDERVRGGGVERDAEARALRARPLAAAPMA